MVVYIIKNRVNGMSYIGCTVRFKERISRHMTGKFSGSVLLYSAIAKYGKENFEVEIIERFDDLVSMQTAERKYIKEYNSTTPSGYNIHYGGLGGKILLTKEQMDAKIENAKKVSKNNIGNKWNIGRVCSRKTKEAVSRAQKGKVISDAHKKAIRERNIGNKWNVGRQRGAEWRARLSKSNKGKVFSDETKLKMSASAKLRMKNVVRDKLGRIVSSKLSK